MFLVKTNKNKKKERNKQKSSHRNEHLPRDYFDQIDWFFKSTRNQSCHIAESNHENIMDSVFLNIMANWLRYYYYKWTTKALQIYFVIQS